MPERFSQDWEYLARKIGYGSKREMLEDMYVNQGLSFSEIASRLGCGQHCVGRNLAKLGIERRGRGGDNNTGTQTRKLFRLDQRTVLLAPFGEAVKHTYVSTSLLYKFRKHMEGSNGVLHNNTNHSSTEVREAE